MPGADAVHEAGCDPVRLGADGGTRSGCVPQTRTGAKTGGVEGRELYGVLDGSGRATNSGKSATLAGLDHAVFRVAPV